MRKIPSLFKRDYDGNRQVYDEVVEGCEWVINGEGMATRKWDGTCCMIRDGVLYKRYDAKKGKIPPEGFEPAQDYDEVTGHMPGWIKVGDGPEDKYHREAFSQKLQILKMDGTYELCGPKINGNTEGLIEHALIRHGCVELNPPRTFNEIKEWFQDKNIEGIVWHHPDGRMCKIKKKDFGLKR